MNTELVSELDNVKQILRILGLSDADAANQFDQLVRVIIMRVTLRTLAPKGYTLSGDVDPKGVEDFLKQHFTEDEIKVILRDEVMAVLQSYFTDALRHASESDRDQIYQLLGVS